MQLTEKSIEIDATVERVFDLFSDFESFPRWMENIKEVRRTGHRRTHWVAAAPLGTSVEWDAETVHFTPDHRIAWRSVRGDVNTVGEVIFEETRRGTTLMHIVLGYDPPAGQLGALIAKLFDKNPEQQLEEDLQRFAAAVGAGRAKPVQRERIDERGREPQQERERARRREEDEDERRERHARARYQAELRMARESLMRGQRQYEREREERRGRDEDVRDDRARRGRRDERPNHPRFADERQRDERAREEYQPRYALTPRERERERRTRREPDYGYTEKAFSRGVDKLMDDAPSRRWRR